MFKLFKNLIAFKIKHTFRKSKKKSPTHSLGNKNTQQIVATTKFAERYFGDNMPRCMTFYYRIHIHKKLLYLFD